MIFFEKGKPGTSTMYYRQDMHPRVSCAGSCAAAAQTRAQRHVAGRICDCKCERLGNDEYYTE